MKKRCQKQEDNSFTLQEMPFAGDNANTWVAAELKETKREIEASKWATRTLKKFKD
jgi:hypothetical protein